MKLSQSNKFNDIEKSKSLETTEVTEDIYISLTSIYQNQHILLLTLKSLLRQTLLPKKIFLYLSKEPYLLDKGFSQKKITDIELLTFLDNQTELINIKWVENEGSFRKLIPLLKEKWNEDCIIITVDDDTIYSPNLIENMISDYQQQRCVINYRGFTPQFKKLKNFKYYKRAKLIQKSLYNFPVGKAGILYKPDFFHNTKNLIFQKDIYLNTCKTGDDIWFYLVRIQNNIECFLDDKNIYMEQDNTQDHGLYKDYNLTSNNNTKMLKNALKRIDKKNKNTTLNRLKSFLCR